MLISELQQLLPGDKVWYIPKHFVWEGRLVGVWDGGVATVRDAESDAVFTVHWEHVFRTKKEAFECAIRMAEKRITRLVDPDDIADEEDLIERLREDMQEGEYLTSPTVITTPLGVAVW